MSVKERERDNVLKAAREFCMGDRKRIQVSCTLFCEAEKLCVSLAPASR